MLVETVVTPVFVLLCCVWSCAELDSLCFHLEMFRYVLLFMSKPKDVITATVRHSIFFDLNAWLCLNLPFLGLIIILHFKYSQISLISGLLSYIVLDALWGEMSLKGFTF